MRSAPATYAKIEQKYHGTDEVLAYEAKRFASAGGRFLHELQVAKVIELIGAAPRAVLEAGCGTGRFTFNIARAGHGVTAVDYSPAMLEACRRRQASEPGGGSVRFEQANIFELPFPDHSFDAVVSIHVLMHLPDHERALRELLRVVKPGGRVIFDIRNSMSLNRVAYPLRRLLQTITGREPWYVWYTTPADVANWARSNGARLTSTAGMFPLKPNRLPRVALPALRWLEAAKEGSWLESVGHIQLVVLSPE